jgi:hypothetical protein
MARMTRDEYAKASGIYGMQAKDIKKETDADKIPDKTCGVCKHYLETSYMSDGRGTCAKLKEGSDITSDPPVFNLEAKNGYILRILSDATKCTYFEKMEFIDKDGHECSDPKYRRSMRQLQDK